MQFKAKIRCHWKPTELPFFFKKVTMLSANQGAEQMKPHTLLLGKQMARLKVDSSLTTSYYEVLCTLLPLLFSH